MPIGLRPSKTSARKGNLTNCSTKALIERTETASNTPPHLSDSMIQQINHLISTGNFTEALKLANDAIQKRPGFYLYHDKKAEVLLGLGNPQEAARSLKEAIRLSPELPFLKQRLTSLASNSPSGIYPASAEETPKPSTHLVGPKDSLPERPKAFCGIYDRYPDTTGKRKDEGGLRLMGQSKFDTLEYPLVTIVTAVFNNPDTLERCIKSVISQNYPNVEHIIIDAGSDEPTLEIIRKHASQIDYYISEPDFGIYHAMNKGIQLAHGQYVCLLNSDDHYDPSFVSQTVSMAQRSRSLLVFSNYMHGDNPIESEGINSGIFFGHLNLNHGAFLVSRQCYNLVGPYSENYKIISDAVWMRAAYKKGVRFDHIPQHLFTFAVDGLSSGGTPAHRRLFILEVVSSYREEFDFLQVNEAEEIYLLRFNPKRLGRVLEIGDKYSNDRFREALANYLKHCFLDRENFRLREETSHELFPAYLKACEKLGIPKSAIRMSTKRGCFSEIISKIDRTIALRKSRSLKTILHFLTVFSALPETFIYDLLIRLENQTEFDNFVMFEYPQLESTRPFAKSIWVSWSDFRPATRNAIYKHVFESLDPDVVVGHFALNTWKLAQRIEPLGIRVPTLSMTHGLDVFMLQTNDPYRDYILNQYLRREDTRFTAVSNYLRNKLIDFGVPSERIDLVYNSINPRFLSHRKPGGGPVPYNSIKLLSVGRLIDCKGHRYLLHALSILRSRGISNITLTLVYGNGGELLQQISDQIAELDLNAQVELIPYVNFEENPEFYSQFDLFVHPSTYSNDNLKRAETFGISVLEAIAAGLPVIATDAGGVPEVIGEPNQFTRIVPHNNADALANAISDTINDPACFEDNRVYAEQRLSQFSEKSQLLALSKAILRVADTGIEAALFSSSTMQGAGYAAYRLHRGLLAGGMVKSTIHTTVRHHQSQPGVRIIPHPTMKDDQWRSLQMSVRSKPNLTMFTVNDPIILNSKLEELIKSSDIINLHWTARFLSLENISYLTNSGKPVVLTLRDMFPITGGCHCFHGCEEWMRECNNCPQLVDHLNNFPAKVLSAKRRNYNFENLTLVALSQHSANILRRAPFFRNCRIEVIPNSIETDVFRPRGREKSRHRFGLPNDRNIIAFIPSFSSDVKGYREAKAAFSNLKATYPELNPLVLLIGRLPANIDDIPFDTHVLGYIPDNETLSFACSAADVVIVPSLEETFSNTTAEAISCGVPVVGFKTGAIPEMATDGQTGYTVEVGDTDAFATSIAKVLTSKNMGQACRQYAETHLKFDLQAQRYEDLFTEIVAMTKPPLSANSRDLAGSFPETTPTIAKILRQRN